jgi:hypothetical protein
MLQEAQKQPWEIEAFWENVQWENEQERAAGVKVKPYDRHNFLADEVSVITASEQAANECNEAVTQAAQRFAMMDSLLLAVQYICEQWDVDAPESTSGEPGEIIKKALDSMWWRRQLRKQVMRRVEHAAIKAGIVGKGGQAYISDESVIRQAKRNAANRKALEKAVMKNENGDEFTIAALCDKGTGNKSNRLDELMTRVRGFDEVAQLLNHAALFLTVTCPSKFHSVGGTNPKYNGASPRDAQRYMRDMYARIRAQLDREDIRPYGFRIAEPHTDGCPHWHLLMFVERKHAARMVEVFRAHAMEEDGDEAGAAEYRFKDVAIEHGNGGSAAAYIIKYISKNIAGVGVGDHLAFESGETITVKPEVIEKMVITPAMRVTSWSQVWGIRQFQQVGGVPVGIWREFRRIKAETIEGAAECVRKAWDAAQAVKSEIEGQAKQADFGGFMQALGGTRTGRDTLVKLSKDKVTIEGRYARYEAEKPIGVYAIEEREVIYKSVRYVWERIGIKEPLALAFGVTRTGVNNCTPVDYPALSKRMKTSTENAAQAVKNKKFDAPAWIDWPSIVRAGREVEKRTKDFASKGNRRALGENMGNGYAAAS